MLGLGRPQAWSADIPVDTFDKPNEGASSVSVSLNQTFGSAGNWKVAGGTVDVIGAGYWQSPDGHQTIDIDGVSVGSMSTTIDVPVSGTVTVSFWLAGNPQNPPTVKHLRVSLGAVAADFSFDITGHALNNMGWVAESVVFTNQSAGLTPLTFTSEDGAIGDSHYGGGAAVGTVSASVVPDSIPTFSQQPSNQVVLVGSTAAFSVSVSGSQPLNYQWLFNGVPLSGATRASYTLAAASAANVGTYSVVVWNGVGTNTSATASLWLDTLQMYAGVNVYGPTGSTIVVQYATDLSSPVTWTPLQSATIITNPMVIIDYDSPNKPRRFYRTVPQ